MATIMADKKKDEDLGRKNDDIDDDEDDLEEEDDDEDEDEDDEPKRRVVKISQEKLDRQLARSHNKGKRAERKALLKELGVESLDEAKTKIAAKDKSDKDDSDKNDEQAQTAKREADEAKREGALAKAEAKIEKILLRKKVKDKRLNRAVKLIDPEEHLESDDDDIVDEVEKLMEEMPELFRGEDDEDEDDDPKSKKRPAKKSTPGGPPRKKKGPSPANKAKDRLQKRHGAKLQNKQ